MTTNKTPALKKRRPKNKSLKIDDERKFRFFFKYLAYIWCYLRRYVGHEKFHFF